MKSVNVAADIGNSAIKLLGPKGMRRQEYSVGWDMDLFPAGANNKVRLAYVSVNPAAEAVLLARLRHIAGVEVVDMAGALDSQKMVDFSDISGMGMDRKSGLLGALAYSAAPLITIDCGTAITVNVLAEHNRCLGGAIAPGVETSLRALRHFTGQLPQVQPAAITKSVANNTEEAMRLGTLRGAAGAIIRLVDCIRRDNFNDKMVPLFITGGFAELLISELGDWQPSLRHVPNLVCEGILRLLDAGNR